MKKSQTTLFFILSIFITLLSIGLMVFLFKVIQNKNQHTSVVVKTLEDKMIEKENTKILEEKIFEIEATEEKIKSFFVNPAEIDSFVTYLENLGSNIGTELIVKNVEISKTDVNNIIVTLSINGSFSKVMQTIILLENTPYQINITQIYLNKETKEITSENGQNQISISGWQADIIFNVLSSK